MTDIPDGITSEHIQQAIMDFEAGVPHEFVDSTAYDLLHEGKRYPPKAILGLAAKQILGEPLKPSDFSGGLKSKCFRVLEDAGFRIVGKRKAEAWMLQGNPDYFDVDRYLRDFDYVYWSVPKAHHHAEMCVGDPVFFWRAKGNSKSISGVVATGVIAESCTDEDEVRFPELIDPDVSTALGKQWNEEQGEKGKIKVGVRVIETRLSPEDGMLTRDGLRMDPVLSQLKAIKVAVSRISRVSGVELQDLSGLWKGVRELTEEHGHSEGSMTRAISIRYERSKSARDACLDSWGYDCQGCGINFEDRYGSIGKEFIHVHHRKPLAEIGEEYEVNPIKDLIPLCPNCHAMVHRKNPPLEIEELQELLNEHQQSPVI